jgi:hypothetical protein
LFYSLFYFASLVAAGIGKRDSCVSAIGSIGRTVFVADARRCDGRRFVVRADEKLTAFVELERAIYEFAVDLIS